MVGGQVTQYVRGLGLTALVQSDGTRLQYVTDGHGDVKKLISGSGAVVADYTYDAFGNQTEASGDTNPFRYSGEYYDAETGLIYLRARYYDSGVGGFISEDPARDGLNWYVYCAGDPVNFVDPTGNHEETIQKMITISNLKMIYINGDHSKSVQTRASNARRYIMNESPLRQYAIFNAITTYYFSDTSRNTLASMIPLIDIAYYTGAAYYMTHDYVSQNDAIAHDMFNPAHDVQSGMVYHIFAFEQQYMQSDTYGRKDFNGLTMELKKESTPQGSVWTLYLQNPVNGRMEERAQIRTSELLGVEVLRNDSLDYSPPKEHGIH